MRTLALALSLVALTVTVGCKKQDDAPPVAAPTGDTTAPTVEAPAAGTTADDPNDDPAKGNINISDEIKRACGITDTEAFFAFDSASVRPQDRAVLKKLAECFTTGPLKGREMRLVGHADPQGSPEYNRVLGSKRAENVKGAIVQAGLPQSQASTTSRGEDDAQGTDEASWAQDRRVDIVLGD